MKKAKKVLAFLLASVLTVGSVPTTAAAAEMGVRPADGTTVGQPFPSGTGGSQNFRIPGLVTLEDGTLVAACDARWNHGGDACGLDTIVSRSTDGGENWSYTFANYLGDYGNQYASLATAFIDPAIATDGKTVYMIADLWPGGYALNTAPKQPPIGDGFDANGHLKLSADNRQTYGYYLEKNEEGASSYYSIKDAATNSVVEGYTVDAFFNLTGNGENSNLFFSDSPYLVFPTDYLYLTTSEDGGENWSLPTLLNIKKTNEQTLLVGPGRGLVTSTGRLIFTAYEWTGGDRNSACFYSDDGGLTWARGQSVSSQSSEAAIVEADGKLYMFTRHGGYYISSDWGETWTNRIEPGITYNQGCQLSAVTYSKKIDGKTAIILSAPSSTASRSAGKLFVGLVQEDGSLSWDYSYSVNGSAYYAYSCLSELKDGTMGLLYENAGTAITYANIPIETIAENGCVSNVWCTDDSGQVTTAANLSSKASVTLKIHGAKDGSYRAEAQDKALLEVNVAGDELTITSKTSVKGLARGIVSLTDGTDTVKITVNVTDATDYVIAELRMGDQKTYPISGNPDLSSLDQAIASVTAENSEMTVEGITEGITSVTADGVTYFIIVKNDEKEVHLEDGERFIAKGSEIQIKADQTIVSVEKNENKPPYEKVKALFEDGLYLIGNDSNIVIGDDSAATNPVGRAMKAADFNRDDLTDYLWNIEKVEGGYTFQTADGEYLTFESSTGSSCSVTVSSTPQTLQIEAGPSGGFAITNGTHYLNNFSGSNVRAAGWNTNDNNWFFYRTADAFVVPGLKEGRTSLAVDGVTYRITVGDPAPVEVEAALAELAKELAAAEKLLTSDKYTADSMKALTDAYTAAKALAGSSTRNLALIQKTTDALKQAVKNLAAKPVESNKDDVIKPPVSPSFPKAGSVYNTKTVSYKVLTSSQAGGTVSYTKPKNKSAKKISVPATVKIGGLTYKVTEIAPNAFKGSKKLTQVVVSANVTKIGKAAFSGSKNLKKITIKSKGIKSVGKQAFANIHKRCVIKVPKQKLKAYKKLFKGKGLKSTMKITK